MRTSNAPTPAIVTHEDGDYHETFQPLFFFPYSLTVSKDSVAFGYYFWIFTKTVDRSEIVNATPLTHVKGFREWGGWGIRLRRHEGHWETGYIAKNGGAVKIEVKSRNGDTSWYAFTCNEPNKVSEILNKNASPSIREPNSVVTKKN